MEVEMLTDETCNEEVAVVVAFLGARIESDVGIVLGAIDQSSWLQLVDVAGQETVGTTWSTK